LGEEDGITEGDAGPGLKQLTVVASASQIATIKKKAEAVLTRGHGSNTIAKVIKAEDVDSGAVNVKLKPGSAALKAWRVRGGDFSQCKSEGGHALCPVCDFEGGAMPCQESRNGAHDPKRERYASNCRTEDGNNWFMHTNNNRAIVFVSLEATPDGTKSSRLFHFVSVSVRTKKTRCALSALFGFPRISR